MKAVAEFTLKNRFNAILLVSVSAAIPVTFWLSAALLALITLRKGYNEGTIALLCSVVGAAIGMTQTDIFLGLLVNPMVFALAIVLRSTNSWLYSLVAGCFLSIVGTLLTHLLLLDFLNKTFDFMVAEYQKIENSEAWVNVILAMKEVAPFGLAPGAVTISILTLILGRSWQAGLFNPGGFQKEFHELRMPPKFLGMLMVTGLGLLAWSPLAIESVIIPLVFCGVALVHGVVKKRDMGTPWLTGFYILTVFFFQLMIPLVVLAAVIDSFVDIRSKLEVAKD